MKKFFALVVFFVLTLTIMPKANAYEPWGVGIYNGTQEVMDYATPGATLGTKIGESTCKTVLGLVNWGDCSLRTAMHNGGITKVTAADWVKRYIVVYGEKTLRVYGN